MELLGSTSVETRDIARNGVIRGQSKLGGCFTGEDPQHDARIGQPRWAGVASVSLVPATCDGGASSRFSLWRIPGRKQLFHAGPELQLWSRTVASAACLRLALGLQDSEAFAYVIPADALATTRLLAVREALDHCHSAAKVFRVRTPVARYSRADLFHMRAIQAFDATLAGASHREIADVLFGSDTVACRWSGDSGIRAQVRYLIKRAKYYVNRGYTALISASET